MDVDFIIAGQGLAGSTLAIRLLRLGKSVLIFDDPANDAASLIAAGLFNPLVFRKITLGWRAWECLDEAGIFYPDLEQQTGESFYHPDGFYRVHGTEFEARTWHRLQETEPFDAFLQNQEDPLLRPFLNQPFGGARVKHSGWVNSPVLLQNLRRKWLENGILSAEKIDYNSVSIQADGIVYKGAKAGKLIFCEGHKADKNPWFDYLPYAPAKGELLLIRAPELKPEVINGGIYVVPMGNAVFRIGATYAWDQENSDTTTEARAELVQKLNALITVPFEIIGQEAGIRPSVQDRRPLAGLHPEFPQLGIFNGFGTKGILLAPLLSKEFAAFLVNNEPFSKDYSIGRYSKLRHSNSPALNK